MTKLANTINREINVTWRFIKSDLWATIIPGLIMTVVTLYHSNLPPSGLATVLAKSIVYFFFYLYTFVLTNQLWGEAEDSINKPFRPLPSKLVTPKGVVIRYLISMILFILWSIFSGVLLWALLWASVSLFHNKLGHKHWLTKNIVSMSLGIFAIIGAAWGMVQPVSSQVLIWGIVMSFALGSCGVIQDFRDVEGDKVLGRRTLPIDLGDMKARIVASAICITSLLGIYIYTFLTATHSVGLSAFIVIIGVCFSLICLRLIRLRTPKDDHQTYMILLYLFNFILLSGLVYL